MNAMQQLNQHIAEIEANLGYVFRDKRLLRLAFTHCSFVNEYRDLGTEHNERLEFLGDSVLNLVVADHLYRSYPTLPEGELSLRRSRLVDADSCLRYILKLDVGSYLVLGKGERRNDGRGRGSILANLFEAIVGAIYLDSDFQQVHNYLVGTFSGDFQAIQQLPNQNWKALLQDHTQRQTQQAPRYEVISEVGPDHNKSFEIAVYIGDEEIGRGSGASKKEAQQAAAADASSRLGLTRH